MKHSLLLAAGMACLSPVLARATPTPDVDRSQAPYFVVDGPRGSTETLPLEQTRSEVQIAGTIAHVRVIQVYRNRGSEPIEATYVFPGSTRAAVFAMRMKVGQRTIEAKIQTKAEARKTYERAKAAGKSASLLEQQRPNVFQMKVANIMPSDRIEVQLDYVEMLVPDAGVYELVIPAVVGPRYAGEQGPGTTAPQEKWVRNPYLKGGKGSPYKWGATVNITAGMPIAGVNSPSHRISPRFDGASTAGVKALDEHGGDRDFVLRYRLTGNQIQSGVLLYPGPSDQENFFALMMSPPRRPAANAIPPREYLFVIDVSGSMGGFPLEVSKALIRKLLGNLKPQDRFNILLFAGGNRVLADQSLPATEENLTKAIEVIDRMRGGGGTQLLPALKRAMKMPRSEEMSTSIVVITDGYVAVEKEAFDIVRSGLNQANLFAFGIGSSVNRFLIEGLARAGMGEPFVILDRKQAPTTADKFRRYIESPVLTNIGVQFDGFDAYDVEPSTVPDLFAERPVLLFGKYRGRPQGRIIVEGRNASGRFRQSVKVASATRDRSLLALRYLWARHRIADLTDRGRLGDRSIKEEVTKLGLQYNLMTDYTSFVAVDSEVRRRGGASKSVVQPLPLPKGVSGRTSGIIRGYGGLGTSGRGVGGGGVRLRATRAYGPPRQMRTSPKRGMIKSRPSSTARLAEGAAAGVKNDKKGSPRVAILRPNKLPAALQQALRRFRSRLGRCAERQTSTPTEGRVAVTVDVTGRITKVEWLTSSGLPAVDRCVSRALRSLRVTKPKAIYRAEFSLRWST